MRYPARYASSLLLLLCVSCSMFAYAQGFKIESLNPPQALGSETFTSLDARFSIALPQQVSGFGPISVDTPTGKTNVGSSYQWDVEGMKFQVWHIDYSNTPKVTADPKGIVSSMTEEVAVETLKRGGKVLSNAEVQVREGVAREVRVELTNGAVIFNRVLVVNQRLYQLLVTFKPDPPPGASRAATATKVFDSFKPLSATEVEAALRKKVEDAAPRPLPQEPVVKRLRSDAQDEGLKGKVKTVLTESQDLSGTWAVQKRKPTAMEYYNEQGYLTRQESYDYQGNPSDISVYGYLDGARVSDTKSLEYAYNPPPMIVAPATGETPLKYDPRYSYKFKFKYDDKGNLLEKVWTGNDGKLWLRYVYHFKGNQKEELVYSADGALNQKYVYKLDDQGNEIEEIIYEARDDSIDSRYTYSYEFDAQGNWTKRISSELVSKDGKEVSQPSSVYYRTITYY